MRVITCADTKVYEEKGAGGASGVRDSLADCGEDHAEAAVPPQPIEHHDEVSGYA